jgi:four helix bundle protein
MPVVQRPGCTGLDCARRQIVASRRVDDLQIWQLASELRDRVYAISNIEQVASDRRFRDRIRESAASVSRNVAEGFGSYRHREFARFLVIARGSLLELSTQVREGARRGYWTTATTRELQDLCNRSIAAVTSLIWHLKSSPDSR